MKIRNNLNSALGGIKMTDLYNLCQRVRARQHIAKNELSDLTAYIAVILRDLKIYNVDADDITMDVVLLLITRSTDPISREHTGFNLRNLTIDALRKGKYIDYNKTFKIGFVPEIGMKGEMYGTHFYQ